MSISVFRASSASSPILLLCALLGCVSPRESEANAAGLEANESTPALAHRLVRDEGAPLLDVRSEREFAAGHIEGAQWIAHDEIEGRVDEIAAQVGGDRSKPIVVYCRSGNRSNAAKAALEQAGFTRVVDLGPMSSWCEDC